MLLIAAFFAVPYLVGRNEVFDLPDLITRRRDRIAFIGYFLMLVFLYVNFYVLVPQLFMRKKYIPYALIVIGSVLFIFAIPLSFVGFPDEGPSQLLDRVAPDRPRFRGPGHPPPRRPPISLFLKHNLIFFAMCFLGTMFWHARRRSLQLEREKREAELAFMRTQMNPHFMFNSLNSAYSLAISEGATRTSDSLLKLSDMMRYLLGQSRKDSVDVREEMKYIEDFVNFQRLRLPENVAVNCNISPPEEALTVAPMLLLPFIENAFKHGVSTERPCTISIDLHSDQRRLILKVENDIVDQQPADREQSGFGFKGTCKRLDLLYPGKHRLEIEEDAAHFCVELALDLS